MIRPIQYLRALAAMMVVWVHSVYIIPGIAERLGAPYFGGSGVDLFFVISGFIMVIITSRTEFTPQKFFLLRLIRVVPLYRQRLSPGSPTRRSNIPSRGCTRLQLPRACCSFPTVRPSFHAACGQSYRTVGH